VRAYSETPKSSYPQICAILRSWIENEWNQKMKEHREPLFQVVVVVAFCFHIQPLVVE
jgi:hypothetical protein